MEKSNVTDFLHKQNDLGFRLSVLNRIHELLTDPENKDWRVKWNNGAVPIDSIGSIGKTLGDILQYRVLKNPENLELTGEKLYGDKSFYCWDAVILNPEIYVPNLDGMEAMESHEAIQELFNGNSRRRYGSSRDYFSGDLSETIYRKDLNVHTGTVLPKRNESWFGEIGEISDFIPVRDGETQVREITSIPYETKFRHKISGWKRIRDNVVDELSFVNFAALRLFQEGYNFISNFGVYNLDN
ncbi:hypothetical protein CMI46_00095 [Candidatus Pacearchaeota archaeon]|nr:hypothetical protein [Candidatus Pacearchaeota archaeon]|tara:strand:- start:1626 stop:2351 length:726 start_codon:yes stop_codon:yes gene_type:complete